jgi:predicted choloylglycine hydrolase
MSLRTHMDFTFESLVEDEPGTKWQSKFDRYWPGYRRWFLRFGEADRPTYYESERALKRHMPEFIPVFESMVDLAGGGDHAARFLSQYCPPPLFRGCSQAIYRENEALMVRSYDYSPYVFDGLIMETRFDQRRVVGMLDCMSGVLDGMNIDGLAVSMSFGGREEFGQGFGVSLILRYLLECAGDVAEASRLLQKIPVHGSYNIMLLDAADNSATIAVSANREPQHLHSSVSTNHQPGSSWPLYEEKVFTHERYDHLSRLIGTPGRSNFQFSREFLQAPLYHHQFGKGFGTLYNAAFCPKSGVCEYFWPDNSWVYDFSGQADRIFHTQFIDSEGFPEQVQSYDDIYTGNPLPIMQS